ncbi:MAG: NAD(P)-dependent oxidoreductase, partial [Nocardioidaceae bacterium]
MASHDRYAALYLDLDGLDTSPGHALLGGHGIDVLEAARDPDAAELERVVALMAGYDPVGADWFDALPNLRLVATHSAGYDMVDLAEVRRRRLWLANVPAGATDEVAVHAFSMALALVRELPDLDAEVRAGRWIDPDRPYPRMPTELTLGIVGMGRIGRALGALASPVFETVAAFDPELPASDWPDDVTRVADLDSLLRDSDCVSLHLPLTPATNRVIDAGRIASMRPGSLLVNVSRGGLVDEHALA